MTEGERSSRLVEEADQDAKELPERKSIEAGGRGEEAALSDADGGLNVVEQKMSDGPKRGCEIPPHSRA